MQQSQQNEHVKYKITAYIERLCLNKQLNFQTKITWKRNVNKVQTEIVTHQECQSIFNQLLQLQLNLIYNPLTARFDPKMTEFAITVIYKGKIKSGGFIKYDAAQIINQNYRNERMRLNLNQCPDPQAFIQVVFDYEISDQGSRSLLSQLSSLNPIQFQKDLSQIDFQQDEEYERDIEEINIGQVEVQGKISIQQRQIKKQQDCQKQYQNLSPFKQKQFCKINNILDRFQNMSRRFKNSHQSFLQEDQNSTKNQSLQVSCIPYQEEKLKMRINQLQRQLQNRDQLILEYEKQLDDNRRYITQLQVKIQILQQKQIQPDEQICNKLKVLSQSENKYRLLYQSTLKQFEQYKINIGSDSNFSKQNLKFTNFIEQLNQIDEVPQFTHQDDHSRGQNIQQLERQNVQLQTKIASMSHNIAQLFNAAYDFGGAKLLDYLQSSIGLIQN